MNRYYPTGVPCLICHQRIDHWDAQDQAQPCGHGHEDTMLEAMWAILSAPRVHIRWPRQYGKTRLALDEARAHTRPDTDG